MALKTHLNPNTIPYKKEILKVVSIHDSAIDWEHSNKQKYIETGFIEHLSFYTDKEPPVYFHLKMIPEKTRISMIAAYSDSKGHPQYQAALARLAFKYMVVKVENVHDSSGQFHSEIKPSYDRTEDDGSTTRIWGDDAMEKIWGLQDDIVNEIGLVAWQRNFLAQGTMTRFTLWGL